VTSVLIFGLDALGSAAYGPEAALTILLPLGVARLAYIGPTIRSDHRAAGNRIPLVPADDRSLSDWRRIVIQSLLKIWVFFRGFSTDLHS
jgi:hypothetical protein